MTDSEIAIERLSAWVRDYGTHKTDTFIEDLAVVLALAKSHIRERPAEEK
jgi:hypothetical protein